MSLQPVSGKTLGVQIADQLRSYILGGGMEPGARLTETELATTLGVSRGSLRDALTRLTDEGILVKEPYKGIRVRSISAKELREIYSMRTALEQFAFREGWERISPGWIADLECRYEALVHARADAKRSEIIELEISFHSWVFELSDHSLLQDAWQNLIPLIKLYLSAHQKKFGTQGVFMSQNERYMKLAQGRDLDRMLEHVAEHMKLGMGEVAAICA